MTAELAKYFADWLREMVPQAPPPHQRDRIEWLLEQLDAIVAAEQA